MCCELFHELLHLYMFVGFLLSTWWGGVLWLVGFNVVRSPESVGVQWRVKVMYHQSLSSCPKVFLYDLCHAI